MSAAKSPLHHHNQMHIPQILQDNAPQIRDIDPDAREVRFDKETWQDIFRQVWEAAEQQVPNYHRVLEEFPDGVLTAASLSHFRHPPIPIPRWRGDDDLEGLLRLEELFLLTMMWTYGLEENGPGRAVWLFNRDETMMLWAMHDRCHYGRLGAAYLDLSVMTGLLKAECCASFLYFLCRGRHAFIKPLPFDMAIRNGLCTVNPEERYLYSEENLARDHWDDYAEYLMLIHNWAASISCRPDQVAEFLRIRGKQHA
jgi:hypothetical protein